MAFGILSYISKQLTPLHLECSFLEQFFLTWEIALIES
jgi:hypothetical protein